MVAEAEVGLGDMGAGQAREVKAEAGGGWAAVGAREDCGGGGLGCLWGVPELGLRKAVMV